MNAYFYTAIIGAASASERPRNGYKSSLVARHRAAGCPQHESTRRTLGRERRSLFVRIANIVALLKSCIIGIILFWPA